MMNNMNDVYSKIGNLIAGISYNRALELYDNWNEYVKYDAKDWGYGGMVISDIIKENNCYEFDNTPSIKVISEIVSYEYSMFKSDYIPDFLQNATYEESDCYYLMTDEEVMGFIDVGIRRFETEKRL